MLSTILITVGAFACLMAMMAVGVIFNGKRLSGSCGGDPDSKDCRCGPEKQERCREKAALAEEDDGGEVPFPTAETLAPPGEERLIQLRGQAPNTDIR